MVRAAEADADSGAGCHTVGKLALEVCKGDFAVFLAKIVGPQFGQDFAAVFGGKAGLGFASRRVAAVFVIGKIEEAQGGESMLPIHNCEALIASAQCAIDKTPQIALCDENAFGTCRSCLFDPVDKGCLVNGYGLFHLAKDLFAGRAFDDDIGRWVARPQFGVHGLDGRGFASGNCWATRRHGGLCNATHYIRQGAILALS